jgi:hypothetical protein
MVRWSIAERFGWTLEYVDTLALSEVHEWLQIEDGRSKARK